MIVLRILVASLIAAVVSSCGEASTSVVPSDSYAASTIDSVFDVISDDPTDEGSNEGDSDPEDPDLKNRVECKVESEIRDSGKDTFQCRRTFDGLRFFNINPVEPSPATDNSWDECKTADLRDGGERIKAEKKTIGFPWFAAGATSLPVGPAKLVAVAIQFPDYEGTKNELEFVRSEIELFNAWVSEASRGRLVPTWTYLDEWLTLDLPAGDYEVGRGFGTEPYQAISEAIVDKVLERIALDEVDELFVYFPDSITRSEIGRGTDSFFGILPQIGVPLREIEDSARGGFEGSRIRHLKGLGTTTWAGYPFSPTLWKQWAHEYMHSIGIALHSPETVGNVGMTGWDRWIAGWLDDSNVICVEELGTQQEYEMVPLEYSSVTDGTNLVVIKVGEYSSVVVESRRLGESVETSDMSEEYGLAVYFMDTENAPVYDMLTNDESKGPAFIFPESVDSGERPADYGVIAQGMERQPLGFVGESFSFGDILIEFVDTGYYDTVRIKRT